MTESIKQENIHTQEKQQQQQKTTKNPKQTTTACLASELCFKVINLALNGLLVKHSWSPLPSEYMLVTL